MNVINMKLALFATSLMIIVCGESQAWSDNVSGIIGIGGPLQTPRSNQWEVLIGGRAGLNATINPGDTTVTINIGSSPIPVLGIRPSNTNGIVSPGAGQTPQINYHGSVDLDGFQGRNITRLTLPVVNESDNTTIGTLSVPFTAGAEFWYGSERRTLYAGGYNALYLGGLPKSATSGFNGREIASSIDNDYVARYVNMGGVEKENDASTQVALTGGVNVSAFYGAGIPAGSDITLKLNTPAGYTPVYWKASLKITVSYY